ncbi:hypothetical protein FA95DRAFT_1560948 [Auriscalpium vulgare]|uniref:Uncharacterized protein n=1 Tax=Auriscalpium vulgare TaxID=40419 RepID=A0ACB8RNB0_9AGAM|nr:hypothetical protein FA95DRAFT_1560948 [Auriscalpium vulgare]
MLQVTVACECWFKDHQDECQRWILEGIPCFSASSETQSVPPEDHGVPSSPSPVEHSARSPLVQSLPVSGPAPGSHRVDSTEGQGAGPSTAQLQDLPRVENELWAELAPQIRKSRIRTMFLALHKIRDEIWEAQETICDAQDRVRGAQEIEERLRARGQVMLERLRSMGAQPANMLADIGADTIFRDPPL